MPINSTNHCFASAIIDFDVRSLLLSYISLIYCQLFWYVSGVQHQPLAAITIASSVPERQFCLTLEASDKEYTHRKKSSKNKEDIDFSDGKCGQNYINSLHFNSIQWMPIFLFGCDRKAQPHNGFFCESHMRPSIDWYTFCIASNFFKSFGCGFDVLQRKRYRIQKRWDEIKNVHNTWPGTMNKYHFEYVDAFLRVTWQRENSEGEREREREKQKQFKPAPHHWFK